MKEETKDKLLAAYEKAFSAIVAADPRMDGSHRFTAYNGGRQNRAFTELLITLEQANKEKAE